MTNRTKCSRNPLEDEAIQKTAERALKELRRREGGQIMEENAMKEQILMKLAEAEKKRGFKQKLKDNAWTIGLGVGTSAPSVGFAIDQQRRNIKKEKATGEKPKSLIERRPGVVSGAVTGGVISPLLRTVMRGSRGGNTSLAQLASEMITGAAGGALSGALIVDPLTRWGTRKYYQHRDKEIERAIHNRTQGSPLQKEAAYGDAVKTLGRKTFKRAESAAIDKFLQSKTKQDFRRAALQIDAIRAADRFVRENAKGITTGALTVGTSGALAGARALIMRQREQEKTASYHAVREMLGLGKEASQAPDGTQATQQEISKRRRHQALEDTILENPRVKFRDLPPLQQAGSMAGGYYGAKKLLKARRGNTWSPAVDAILGAAIGSSVGNLLGAIATDATIRHEEKASQKRK